MIRHYRHRAWLVMIVAAMPLACLAQPAANTAQLEAITILGARTHAAPDALPRSIEVIGQDQIAREQSATLGGIVAGLPNISLTNGPRPAAQQIRIRGLSGKHVLLLIDGIRQDFDVGHMGTGFIAPGLLESVEIQRGPAAVLWGGGAVGGVISVNTKEAADLLAADDMLGARLYGGYRSASAGWATRAAVYGRLGDNVDALVQLGRLSNENLALGDGSTLAHSAYRRTSLLAKSTVRLAPGNSVRLSHRRMRLQGVSPGAPAGTGSALEDREVSVNASRIEWKLLPAQSSWLDLTAGLSHIRTQVDEVELANGTHDNTVIAGLGIDIANTSRIDWGSAGRHVLTYGFDVNRKRVEASRNGHARPSTPDGSRLLAGVFVQDAIHWGEAWTATLGLRYDHYQSESDANVAPDNSDDALSAQVGLLWQATHWLQLYARYAEAFRAPSVGELYISGRHSFGGGPAYATFKPNPNLQPERAANKEFGIRTHWQGLLAPRDELRFELSVFRNDIDDYIESYMSGHFPHWTIGYRNAAEVRLEGFEASARYATERWFVALSYGQTHGRNETKNRPLADIPADTWVLRAGVTALPWDGRIVWRMTHAEAQERVPAGTPTTDSYTVHDLVTSWHPSDNLRLDFGIGNITDRDYRRHTALIKSAGRNVKFGLTYKF